MSAIPSSSAAGSVDAATRPSIFLRLKQSDRAPRELAWRQFYDQYAPVISSYARRKGASPQQAEEIVQDVISGFYAASPRFIYDPARGRFRGYLKTCVARAMSRISRAKSTARNVSVDAVEIPDGQSEDDELWDRIWRQELLRRALEIVRAHYSRKGKLQTFEAFKQNVVLGVPAAEVARTMNVKVNVVHVAKTRVSDKLREVRQTLHDEEG